MNPLYAISTAFGPFSLFAGIPAALQTGSAESFLNELDGPAAFILNEGHETTRFVSCLLHGNEASGLHAVARMFATNPHSPHANMVYFVGHVRAAKFGAGKPFRHRLIDIPGLLGSQRDMNRIWGGSVPSEVQVLVDSVMEIAAQMRVAAALDFHNTSGANPPFGVVLPDSIGASLLAAQFAPRLIELPLHSGLIGALSPYCDSVVLECGKLGLVTSDDFALMSLRRFLNHELNIEDPAVTRYRSAAEVYLNPGLSFDFGGMGFNSERVSLVAHLEDLNFRASDQPRLVGRFGGDQEPFHLSDDQEPTHYFGFDDEGYIWLKPGFEIAMATLHADNIRNSCLFYLLAAN